MQKNDQTRHHPTKSTATQTTGSTEPVTEVRIFAPQDDESDFLIRELKQLHAEVQRVWPMPELLPIDVDVIYCDYRSDLTRHLPWVPGDAKAALVLILPLSEAIDAETIVHLTPNAILPRPFTSNSIVASLVQARSQFRYEQRLRSKADRLDENLRSIRTVERAKSILMKLRNISNDEAYNFIRRRAMDRRTSVSSVATAIVASHELLSIV